MYLDLHTHERDATEFWRPVEPQPVIESTVTGPMVSHRDMGGYFAQHVFDACATKLLPCRWKLGDVLACREDFIPCNQCGFQCDPSEATYVCFVDGFQMNKAGVQSPWRTSDDSILPPAPNWGPDYKFYPAVALPDWAIRRRVTVRQVEVRRVSTITEEEAMAAGFVAIGCGVTGRCVPDPEWARDGFREWWDSAFPAHPWASEPWAWRVVVESLNKE